MARLNSVHVPLDLEEMAALISAAQRDYRHPREQARYILRKALLDEQTTPAAAATATAKTAKSAKGAASA